MKNSLFNFVSVSLTLLLMFLSLSAMAQRPVMNWSKDYQKAANQFATDLGVTPQPVVNIGKTAAVASTPSMETSIVRAAQVASPLTLFSTWSELASQPQLSHQRAHLTIYTNQGATLVDFYKLSSQTLSISLYDGHTYDWSIIKGDLPDIGYNYPLKPLSH